MQQIKQYRVPHGDYSICKSQIVFVDLTKRLYFNIKCYEWFLSGALWEGSRVANMNENKNQSMEQKKRGYHTDLLANNVRLDYLCVRENYKADLYTHVTKESMAFIRFIYIYSGDVMICYGDNQTFYASANDLLYLPYGLSYISHWRGHPCSHYLVIDIALCDTDDQVFHFGSEPTILMHDNHGIYSGVFSELSNSYDNHHPFFVMGCLSTIFKFCYDMASMHDSKIEEAKYRHILQGVFYLENNYLQDFNVAHLAHICAMSESNFRRLFCEYKGMPPLKYKNMLRFRKANELLRSGQYSITQVAEILNFYDVKHFSKLYKRYYGYSPSDVLPPPKRKKDRCTKSTK